MKEESYHFPSSKNDMPAGKKNYEYLYFLFYLMINAHSIFCLNDHSCGKNEYNIVLFF